jgi:hypothetical protein
MLPESPEGAKSLQVKWSHARMRMFPGKLTTSATAFPLTPSPWEVHRLFCYPTVTEPVVTRSNETCIMVP